MGILKHRVPAPGRGIRYIPSYLPGGRVKRPFPKAN
jgi:hypothetical protein